MVVIAWLGLWSHVASGEGENAETKASAGHAARPVGDSSNPYSGLDDEQLEALAGTFQDLDLDQRRWFLTEVRKRMNSKGERPRIPVSDRARFGRVIRNAATTAAETGSLEQENNLRVLPAIQVQQVQVEVFGTGLSDGPPEEDEKPVSMPAVQTKDPPRRSEE